jgi:hypothetical protein
MPITLDLEKYDRAAHRGAQWCLDLQNPDGSIHQEPGEDCFDSIYKFPATFVTLGYYVEGAKLLNWIENNTLTDAGDISFRERKLIHDWHKRHCTYVNSWTIIGAQRAGFFRLADRCMKYMIRYQSPKTGAFQSGPIESDKSGICDTTITSQGGICCLYTGRMEAATRAAESLCRLAKLQKDGDQNFYFCMDANGELVKTPQPGSVPAWTWVDSTNPQQCFWYLGIAAAFLIHMFEMTGERRYLESATKYLDFLLRSKGAITSLASGKFGYAAALMYRTTGETRYRDAAIAHADWLVSYQKPDGRWFNDEPDYPWYFIYDCTAEMAYWLAEITKILSSPRTSTASK